MAKRKCEGEEMTSHEWKESACGCRVCLDANCEVHNTCIHLAGKQMTHSPIKYRVQPAFTDKNLAALKASSERLFCKGTDCASITLSLAELDSLVARLEAAEECLLSIHEDYGIDIESSISDRLYNNWRKAAGKE